MTSNTVIMYVYHSLRHMTTNRNTLCQRTAK